MSESRETYGITTQDAFEYKLLMRVRSLRRSGARLLVDLDSEELQVCGRIESLNAKSVSATGPLGAVLVS